VHRLPSRAEQDDGPAGAAGLRGLSPLSLKREVLRAQILTAAADLFGERRFRAATLDDLARRVGMSKPTLYGYFRSKEDLLAAIFHRTMSLFEERLAAIQERRLSPAEELREVVRHHVRTVVAERSFLSVFFGEEANLPARLGRAITRRKARYDARLVALVRRGQKAGVFRDGEPRLLVFALLGMSNWVYKWYDPTGTWDADTIAEGFIALVEPGYLASPPYEELGRQLARIEREIQRTRASLPGARGITRRG
jgi:AcrR family transcriptional regulator